MSEKEVEVVVGKLKIIVKESAENPALGVIIDVYAANAEDADPLESYTLWYDDYWEDRDGEGD